MPKKPSRKSPTKDANGGKLGQFTTEVNKTFEDGKKEGKEEQKRESAKVFMGELERAEKQYSLLLERAKEEYEGENRKLSLAIGIVIGSALAAILLSV